MTRLITFTVAGLPAPWTSPRRGRGGGSIPTPASSRMKAWQERVRLAATAAMRGRARIDGPVSLVLSFEMGGDDPRLTVIAEAMGSEPGVTMHTKKPDLTNLVKAAEDAMSGIVFKDDCQVAAQMTYKFGGNLTGAKPCSAKRRTSRRS